MYWPHERNTKKERYLQEKDFRAVKYHDLSVSTLKWRLAFIDCSLCPICFATTHNGVLCWWQRDTMWPWPELELGRLNIRTRENRNEPWRMLLQPPKAHQIAVEWGPGSSDTTIAMSIKCYGSLLTGTQGIKDRTLEIDLLSSQIILLYGDTGERGWIHGYMLFSIYFKLYPDIDRYWPDQDIPRQWQLTSIPCVQWQYDMEIWRIHLEREADLVSCSLSLWVYCKLSLLVSAASKLWYPDPDTH